MLYPKTRNFADLVRNNQHLFSVGPAYSDEIEVLKTSFDHEPGPFLDDWMFIALRDGDACAIHVMGRVRGVARISTEITALDEGLARTDEGLVLTLCKPHRSDEVPPDYLVILATVLRLWGYDSAYNLGVPMAVL